MFVVWAQFICVEALWWGAGLVCLFIDEAPTFILLWITSFPWIVLAFTVYVYISAPMDSISDERQDDGEGLGASSDSPNRTDNATAPPVLSVPSGGHTHAHAHARTRASLSFDSDGDDPVLVLANENP